MSLNPNSMEARDVAHMLHPITNAKKHLTVGPLIIERGDGIYVYDNSGKRYIDGLAGLWNAALGFNEKRLTAAAMRQMEKLPYYHTFGHKSNEPAINLTERLVEMTPKRLEKVFFTNSGSEANDTVMKLLWYFNNARGKPKKKKMISRVRAYHGITIASGSLTGLPANHQDFDLPLPGVFHVQAPHHYRNAKPGESEEDFSTRLAEELDALIQREGAETVAAFIGEPVMGAGGVIVPPRTYWKKIQEVCRKHDVMVIADEVITGFGRLGKPFGCDLFEIDPDILVLSKQITSGYHPLAAVLISDELFQPIAANSDRIGIFGHGFTTTGNPLAAAIALETLDIMKERRVMEHAAEMGSHLQEGLRKFASHPLVGEVRGVGLLAGVELVADKATKQPFQPTGPVAAYLFARAQEKGLILRPIGETVAFCPPLIITASQIAELLSIFGSALDDTWAWVQKNRASA